MWNCLVVTISAPPGRHRGRMLKARSLGGRRRVPASDTLRKWPCISVKSGGRFQPYNENFCLIFPRRPFSRPGPSPTRSSCPPRLKSGRTPPVHVVPGPVHRVPRLNPRGCCSRRSAAPSRSTFATPPGRTPGFRASSSSRYARASAQRRALSSLIVCASFMVIEQKLTEQSSKM